MTAVPPRPEPRPGQVEGPLWQGEPEPMLPSLATPPPALEGDVETKPRRRSRWLWWMLTLSIAAFAGYELTFFVLGAWAVSPVLGGGFAALLAALLASAIYFVGAELRELRKLRRMEKDHALAASLLSSGGYGQALPLATRVMRHLPVPEATRRLFAASVYDTHSDADVLHIFGRIVLRPLDQKAYAIISRAARGSAVGVTVSPIASLDALITLWRSIKMIRGIAETYGFRPSLPGTLVLARELLLSSALTAGADIVGSFWAEHLGHRIAGALSARLGEGLFAAIRVTRLGLCAMELCRPLPFGDDDQPSLNRLRQEVIADLASRD